MNWRFALRRSKPEVVTLEGAVANPSGLEHSSMPRIWGYILLSVLFLNIQKFHSELPSPQTLKDIFCPPRNTLLFRNHLRQIFLYFHMSPIRLQSESDIYLYLFASIFLQINFRPRSYNRKAQFLPRTLNIHWHIPNWLFRAKFA